MVDSIKIILSDLEKLHLKTPQAVSQNWHSFNFEDAEDDPDPVIYFDANWKKVKQFFRKETVLLAKKLMNLK